MLFPSYCVCLLSVGPCMLMYLFYSVFKQHLFIYLFIFTLVLLSVGWFAGWSVSSITQKLLKRFKLGRGQIHWFFFSLSVTLWDIFVDFLGHNAWILIKKKINKFGTLVFEWDQKQLLGLGEVLRSTGCDSSLQHLTCQSFLFISLHRLFFLECWSRLWTAETRWLRSI